MEYFDKESYEASIDKETCTKCLITIAEANAKEALTDNDIRCLRVYEYDKYSHFRSPKKMGLSVEETKVINENLKPYATKSQAYRMCARGLQPEKAAQYANYWGWENKLREDELLNYHHMKRSFPTSTDRKYNLL